MGYLNWTKAWSALDNGTILNGGHIGTLQSDIVAVLNGGISDANVASAAAILESKIAFNLTTGHNHDGANSRTISSQQSAARHARFGMECKFSTTTLINVTVGVLSFDGSSVVTNATDTTISVATSGNYLTGSPAGNQIVYVYVSAAGTLKLAVSAPNASDTSGTSTGKLQYRSFSGTYYRCLGAVRMDSATTYIEFTRQYKTVLLTDNLAALSAGASATFAAVDLSARVPAISTLAILAIKVGNGADPTNAFVRATGTAGNGLSVLGSSVTEMVAQFLVPTNTSQSIDYKTDAGAVYIYIHGYVDDLD